MRWAGDGELGGSLRSPLAEQGLDPSAPVPYCSRLQPRVRILVDGSLRLQAAQPDDAGRYTCVPSTGLPRSPSASAYLAVLCKPHPAPWTDCFTSLGQAQLLPDNLPLLPPDPAQVTAMPPETPLPVGMRGVIRCPVRANPPTALCQLDQGWAGPAAGQGTGLGQGREGLAWGYSSQDNRGSI